MYDSLVHVDGKGNMKTGSNYSISVLQHMRSSLKANHCLQSSLSPRCLTPAAPLWLGADWICEKSQLMISRARCRENEQVSALARRQWLLRRSLSVRAKMLDYCVQVSFSRSVVLILPEEKRPEEDLYYYLSSFAHLMFFLQLFLLFMTTLTSCWIRLPLKRDMTFVNHIKTLDTNLSHRHIIILISLHWESNTASNGEQALNRCSSVLQYRGMLQSVGYLCWGAQGGSRM